MFLLALEHAVGIGVFNPAIGGDPLLFQRLFWFFARPALGIMILPAIGIISELLRVHSRQGLFGYKGMVFSIVAVAGLSFFTTGGHLFSAPGSVAAAVVSSVFGFLTTIPFLVILSNWILTLAKGTIYYSAAMFYVLGCIALIIAGGLGGLFLAVSGAGAHLQSSYFVVAHLHYLMAGAALMAYLGGLHYWWSDLSGRHLPDVLGKVSAILVFLGINLTFLPQFFLGFLGMPRRYSAYPVEFETLQVLATAGIPVLLLGYLGPMIYLAISMRWGKVSRSDSRFEIRDSVPIR